MYQVLVLGPCQVAAPLVSAVTQSATCHPSLVIMMAVMALTTTWTLALLACQLYQVNMVWNLRMLLFYLAPIYLHLQFILLVNIQKVLQTE